MFARLLTEVLLICRLKRGPQDLPHAPQLALLMLAVAQVLKLVNSAQLGETRYALASSVLSFLFALASTWLVLRMRGHPDRFWQTLLALAATGVLIAALAFPVAMAIGPLGPISPDQPPSVPAPLMLIILGLAIWRLVVAGHIWRHALEVPLPIAILIVIALFLAELIFQGALLGAGLESADPAPSPAPAPAPGGPSV